MNFPLFNTKTLSKGKKYNLNDSVERRKYFTDKAGEQIENIKTYLDNNKFLAIMLAKKSAGKGTYSKMFAEIVGEDRVSHISIGDIVRDIHTVVDQDAPRKEEVMNYLKENYRGYISLEEAIDAFINKNQSNLIPTEFILTLIKMELERIEGNAVFLDGFPRNLDQVSYSLYFREIMDMEAGPDFFVLIDVPETVIDARIKSRRICPKCHTSRNLSLLPTKFVRYNKEKDEFVLLCDNESCEGYEKTELVEKEGDSAGIDPIRKRLETEGGLISKVESLHGVPKVKIRNTLPADKALDIAEEFEITPEFYFELGDKGNVVTKERPWTVPDDNGVESYSLMAPAGVISLLYQIDSILKNGENTVFE